MVYIGQLPAQPDVRFLLLCFNTFVVEVVSTDGGDNDEPAEVINHSHQLQESEEHEDTHIKDVVGPFHMFHLRNCGTGLNLVQGDDTSHGVDPNKERDHLEYEVQSWSENDREVFVQKV